MKSANTRLIVVILFVALAGASVSVAHKRGADAGHTASPAIGAGIAFNGANCTKCHPFNEGVGSVELLGYPRRYRPDTSYDLTVRITDTELNPSGVGLLMDGAGFQISAEGGGQWLGTFTFGADGFTRRSMQSPDYLTHTMEGFEDSRTNWAAGGGAYDFNVQWQAPDVDQGPITFFVAANSIDDEAFFSGVHYYWSHVTSHFAISGDGDGDADLDLRDVAMLYRCFNDGDPATGDGCEFLDADGNDTVGLADAQAQHSSLTGPTAPAPAAYLLADAVRGGRLYDEWWAENGVAEPTDDHPLYPATGMQAGSTTYRCKECHGWDYEGAAGAYGSGDHFTGIQGIRNTSLTPEQLFALLNSPGADDGGIEGGHDMAGLGMSDRDLWDVVKMTLEGVVDTSLYIDTLAACANGDFIDEMGMCIDDTTLGSDAFGAPRCVQCHGDDGDMINFGTDMNPEFVGTVANDNPWEFLHKVRFGQPGRPMISAELLLWDVGKVAQVGAYAATLPR